MRTILVSIFGIIPATLLCFFVLPLLLYAVSDFFLFRDTLHLLRIFWCIAAISGTVALFFSANDSPNWFTMIALALGIWAVLSSGQLDYFGRGRISSSSGFYLWVLASPPLVAFFLIIEGIFRPPEESTSYDDW